MKFLIVFVALFAVALAAEVEITRESSDVQPDGYKFGFATNDGSSHDAEGHLEYENTDHETLKVRGTYSFVADDGQTYTVNYVADENGFQPQGAHLPVA